MSIVWSTPRRPAPARAVWFTRSQKRCKAYSTTITRTRFAAGRSKGRRIGFGPVRGMLSRVPKVEPKERPRLLCAGAFADAQERPRRLTHPSSPAEGGNRLTLAGAVAGIACVHGKSGEKKQSAPQGPQGRMMGHEPGQQQIEVVCLRHRKPAFFHQAFKVLLGTLLAMKADAVMNRNLASAAVLGEHVILLGLLDPLPRRLFH